jgi:hypothetical protein
MIAFYFIPLIGWTIAIYYVWRCNKTIKKIEEIIEKIIQ